MNKSGNNSSLKLFEPLIVASINHISYIRESVSITSKTAEILIKNVDQMFKKIEDSHSKMIFCKKRKNQIG